MKIVLSDAGKRYNRDWIFRHLNFTFEKNNAYAITGSNGSGKSTLLQTIGGVIGFTEGTGSWQLNETQIATEKIYRHISICAPYLELIEEMTLREFLTFHNHFKPFLSGVTIDAMIDEIDLTSTGNKKIEQFSSGMKQRVKLAQCIFSDTPLVLLDEPCTNLDATGIELYHQLIKKYCKNRVVIVSSNDEIEYGFCNQFLNIQQYKNG
jgi:ABC-type multidrug transport system ATPase subunit